MQSAKKRFVIIGIVVFFALVLWGAKNKSAIAGFFGNSADDPIAEIRKELKASKEEAKATEEKVSQLENAQASTQTQMEQAQLEQKNLAAGVAQTAKGLKETNLRLDNVEQNQKELVAGFNDLNAGQDQIIGGVTQLKKQVDLNNKAHDESERKRDAQAAEIGKTLNGLGAKIENGNQKIGQMYQEQLAQAAKQEEANKTRMAVTVEKTEVSAYKDKNNDGFPMLRAVLGFTTWNAGKKGLVAVPCIKTDPSESASYHLVGGALQSVYSNDSTQSFSREFSLPLQLTPEVQRYWIAIKFFDANDKEFTHPIGTTQWTEAPALPANSKDNLPALKRRNG